LPGSVFAGIVGCDACRIGIAPLRGLPVDLPSITNGQQVDRIPFKIQSVNVPVVRPDATTVDGSQLTGAGRRPWPRNRG
jgi:hypothetical protein